MTQARLERLLAPIGFRADLTSIQNAISSHNNDFLRFKDLVDEQTSVYQGLSSAMGLDFK